MHTKTMTIPAAAILVLLLTGCAGQAALEADFGNSVRHMTLQQIHDLDAAYNPDPAPVQGAEVGSLNTVLESYRGAIGNHAEVGTPAASAGRK